MTARASSPPLQLVLIGCGQAARMHARTIRSLGSGHRLYFASRDPERARRHQKRFGGAGAFTSYEEALADPRPDVAIVTTPPSTHLPIALDAFRAGKHVIMEKPPFPRASDFDIALQEAARAGRQLLVAENYFYKPLAVALRRTISRGDIGEPRILSVNALKRQRVEGWREEPELVRGGAMYEGGVHWVNFMANLGPAVRSAHGFRPGERDGLERTMVSVFEYENGAVGTLYYSWEVDSPLRGLRTSRIIGEWGTITFETNGLWMLTYGRRKRFGLPGVRDISGFRAMFRDFLDALASDREPQMTSARARRDLELVEQIYSSAGEHAPA